MEHRINIEGIIQSINREVQELPPLPPECCIYKVNEGLRKVKPEAYEPMLVSIGPYHLQDTKLHAMRKHKLWYLHLLLERRNEESVKRHILELANLEDRARKCYADPIPLNCDEFVEMMLLDGCFIIEYCRKITSHQLVDNDDPIFKVKWMLYQIFRDMMLLENQLPYFVLSQLYDITKDANEIPFSEMTKSIFNGFLKPRQLNSITVGRNDIQEIKHLLRLVHVLCHPSPKPARSESITRNNILMMLKQMRNVVELQEFGVKFVKVGMPFMTTDNDANNVHLFDIKFHNGLMKVPCFVVEKFTNAFFRNLIAYEQHSPDVDVKYFSDFAIFMDQLISIEKDVNLLRLKGIIVMPSEDKAMSDLFNSLSRGIVTSSNFYYSDVWDELNKHCGKHWNEMMAKLRRDYFNSPWVGVSTIGAIVLLLLALAQTIVTIIK